MAHYNFEKDLADGHKAEDEAKVLIAQFFEVPITDITTNATKEYDFKINCSQLCFEVKNDLMAHITGNLAIEYESRGKASGITTSKAHYWIYKFSNQYYLLKSELLKKELFENKNYFKTVTGGDTGSNTKMFLVKVAEFIKWATKLN